MINSNYPSEPLLYAKDTSEDAITPPEIFKGNDLVEYPAFNGESIGKQFRRIARSSPPPSIDQLILKWGFEFDTF